MALMLAGIVLLAAPAAAQPVHVAPPPTTGPTSASAPAAPADEQPPDEQLADEKPGDQQGVDKIEADLLATLDGEGSADFYVDLTERADLAPAAAIADWDERGAAVVQALQDTAESTQADLRAQLDEAKVAYTSFWISNTILVRSGPRDLAGALASDSGVEALRAPQTVEIPEPVTGLDEQAIDAVEWGIDRIQADEVWATYAVRGERIVVGSIDTGVAFRHPALAAQYRGNDGDTVDHDYNWFDPTRLCPTPEPCDNNDHGTHTMGTMVGDGGAGNQIGVAPRARWIAAKGCEINTCTNAALLASGQWMLAPTRIDGTGADSAQRPHIVNNSWGGAPGLTWYRDIVNSWRAAGIFPAFSNGNSGPGCRTAGSPGDDQQAFASGSFDIANAIASTSSRGAAAGGWIKPNLAAPGVNVRSAVRSGGYASFSGTSMASPHTAGTVALMWSAAPALARDVSGTIALLNQTAVDTSNLTCGGTAANNNVWGEGKLDALAAVTQSPRSPVGTLTGTVSDAGTGAPIAGVRVAVEGPYIRIANTGADGRYTVVVPAGDYTVTATTFGYEPLSAPVTVIAATEVTLDLALPADPTGAVRGLVSSGGAPAASVTVTIDGTPIPPTATATDGSYAFAAVPFGAYRVTITGGGCYTPVTVDLTVDGDETLDVTLVRIIDAYGYTCVLEAGGYNPADTPLNPELVGDDRAAWVDLPFPFFLYGTQYSRASISTNGHVNFLASVTAHSNVPLPNAAAPNAAVYAFWDDLNVEAGTGRVLTKTIESAGNRSFIIEWRDASFYNDTTGLRVDVQAQLNEDGTVVTRYRNLSLDPRELGESATVGIENATGNVALQYSHNSPVLSNDRSVRFVPPPNGIVSGVLTDANDNQPISGATVRAAQDAVVAGTATTGTDGRYSLRLKVGAYSVEASKTNYITAGTTVDVTAGQAIERNFALATAAATLTPPDVSFLGNADQLRTARVTLANPSTSGVSLTYSLMDGQSWLWTVPAAGSVAPGGSATLTVRSDATGIAAGVHRGAVAITTNAGRTPSLQVPVTLVVPRYRQGINTGGDAATDSAGDPWAADRAWTPGGYGYLGAGWTVTTRQPIAGTDDDALHQTMREATSGYRFDNLPGGTYVVELDVTESRRALAPGRRVFDVSINGALVLADYDPVAAVGTVTLHRQEFTVTVADGGAIAVDLGAKRGKLPPIVSAVRITHRPDR